MFSRQALSNLNLAVLGFSTVASASGPPYHSLGDIFQGQLARLQFSPNTHRSPALGGQSGIHCCLLAVNESLGIEAGNLIFLPGQTALRGNASEFLRYQFPCTASYNGSNGDQPQVWVNYNWCITHCPGWSLSVTGANLGQWVQPFIQYITPAIVFVLNIPRRRRLGVPGSLFPRSFDGILDIFGIIYKVLGASIIVTLDTVCWLIIVLSMSGPILLSGIYEALLDLRLLRFLSSRIKKNTLTVRERSHLLYIILLGNLDQNPAWDDSLHAVANLPNDNLRRRHSSAVRIPSVQTNSEAVSKESRDKTEYDFTNYDVLTKSSIESVKIKLKSMLGSQPSFGSSVGAAIVFFTGSFCYTLIDVQSTYGNNGAAHRLAFGMFWMIIPHVAVVGSLLLAGSNPCAWTSINETTNASVSESSGDDTVLAGHDNGVSNVKMRTKDPRATRSVIMRIVYFVYSPVYETKYQPTWLWDRGGCKATWIAKITEEYPRVHSLSSDVLEMGFKGWSICVLGPATTLLVIPAFCGGLVSYTTPAVGWSCRSMVMLIYACAEFLLMLLWLWDLAFWKTKPDRSINTSQVSRPRLSFKTAWWYILVSLSIAMGFFTSIGGTVFFLMGLYTNCLCKIPIQYWSSRHTNPNAQSALSSGNSEQTYYARTFWFPSGIATTVFLVLVTYCGWWYQRHLRGKFDQLVTWIDCVNTEDIQENYEEQDIISELRV